MRAEKCGTRLAEYPPFLAVGCAPVLVTLWFYPVINPLIDLWELLSNLLALRPNRSITMTFREGQSDRVHSDRAECVFQARECDQSPANWLALA